MNSDNRNENSPPELEAFKSLDTAIQEKIKHYKQAAEELEGEQ